MIPDYEQRERIADLPKARVLSRQLDSAVAAAKGLESLFDDSAAIELCVSMYNLLDNCPEQLRLLERRIARGDAALRPSALELALRHLEERPQTTNHQEKAHGHAHDHRD